jgi:hypothetical protein
MDFIASALENKQINAELPTIHAAGKLLFFNVRISAYITHRVAKERI